MACYRNGGCGPYEMYSCSQCPASKPEYLKREEGEKMNGCDGKFLVLKSEDIQKHLSEEEQEQLLHMTQKIGAGRIQEGKNPFNEYWVCSKDEPYANVVYHNILIGEKIKTGEIPKIIQ